MISMTLPEMSNRSPALRDRCRRAAGILFLTVFVLTLLASAPVAADSDGSSATEDGRVTICDAKLLPNLLNAVIQISVWGSMSFAFATYVGTNAVESLPVGQKHKEWAKEKRWDAIAGAGKTFVVGPVLAAVVYASNTPVASCIQLMPF